MEDRLELTPELTEELITALRSEVIRLQIENIDLKAIIAASKKKEAVKQDQD